MPREPAPPREGPSPDGPSRDGERWRPEQLAALDFARRRGSEATVEAVRSLAARAFAALDALLEGVDEETARRRPESGGWSVQEVADHLVISHERAAEQLASLLAGRAPEGGPVPAGLQSEDPFTVAWPEMRRRVAAVHAGILERLAAADDTIPLAPRTPVAMAVRCTAPGGGYEWVEWEQSFDWKAFVVLFAAHAREHIRQVERLL